jgi:hypothetical protein
MHAVIEFAKKKNEIFVPQQWATANFTWASLSVYLRPYVTCGIVAYEVVSRQIVAT